MAGEGTARTVTAARQSRSHTSRVVGALGLAIVSGAQPEGSLLPGDVELLDRFKVSRTVIREALKTLAAKGMLQARARVGTRVRPRAEWNLFDPDVLRWHVEAGLRPDFFVHLAEIRMVLEPEAAAFAASRRTEADVAEINGWAEQMGQQRRNSAAFAKADLGFHLAVARAAQNPFFISISTLIEVVLVAMLTISSPSDDPERHEASVAQHRRIAEAIANRRPDEARAAMRDVVQNGVDNARRVGGLFV